VKISIFILAICLSAGCAIGADIDYKKFGIEPGTAVFPSLKTGYALQYAEGIKNILKTEDGGKTWKVCRKGKVIMEHDDEAPEGESPGSENIDILCFPDENNGFAYGGGQISIPIFLTTRDGGLTWEEAGPDKIELLICDGIQAMLMFSANEGYILNLAGGLLKTSNGWKEAKKMYPGKPDDIYSPGWPVRDFICFRDINTGFLIVEKGVIYTADGGKTWRLTLPFDGYQAEKVVRMTDHVLIILKNTSLGYSSTNFGAAWNSCRWD